MRVKEQLIQILEENRNTTISGQALADQLHVTRSAIWKAMELIKKEGYAIQATPNKGYTLLENSDVLSVPGIQHYLQRDIDIFIYDSLPSTNTAMKRLAIDNGKHCSVILANEQTAGRGRFDRSFYSPLNKGIYMSILVKQKKKFQHSTRITLQTAVALTRAIETLYGIKTQIKWVNDIYYHGKKLCGILSEAISDFESGMIESIIVGIGINVSTTLDDFPKELQNTATSLDFLQVNRNQFIASILHNFFNVIEEDDSSILQEYREKSCILHKTIHFMKDNSMVKGYAKDINEEGNLVIAYDHTEIILNSGEISIGVEE